MTGGVRYLFSSWMVGGVLAGIVSGVLPVGVGDPLPVQMSGVGRWRAVGGDGCI